MTKSTSSSRLSQAELEHFRAALSHKREQLLSARAASEADRRGQNEAEPESGDLAEQAIEQESALNVGAFDERLLTEVERALAKFDAGTYGISEGTGEPIARERLEAVPWARGSVHEGH
jgi:DnaK suppressor protein